MKVNSICFAEAHLLQFMHMNFFPLSKFYFHYSPRKEKNLKMSLMIIQLGVLHQPLKIRLKFALKQIRKFRPLQKNFQSIFFHSRQHMVKKLKSSPIYLTITPHFFLKPIKLVEFQTNQNATKFEYNALVINYSFL